jgi:DNA-binding transcriptional LysR family regulator
MAFALAGSGIALLPEWLVAAALADSALVKVMPAFSFPRQGCTRFTRTRSTFPSGSGRLLIFSASAWVNWVLALSACG